MISDLSYVEEFIKLPKIGRKPTPTNSTGNVAHQPQPKKTSIFTKARRFTGNSLIALGKFYKVSGKTIGAAGKISKFVSNTVSKPFTITGKTIKVPGKALIAVGNFIKGKKEKGIRAKVGKTIRTTGELFHNLGAGVEGLGHLAKVPSNLVTLAVNPLAKAYVGIGTGLEKAGRFIHGGYKDK